ncbi:AIPR family protein [Kitasatospora cineracea]|uniref:AIPR family protein n=1 Tax=Kitasatospora cineracea TaxID=88074 RepID=UPI003433DB67
MEDRTDALRGAPLGVRQVRAALTREFAALLDLADLGPCPPDERERAFLTRALAAKAGQLSADCTAAQAAGAVIDGVDDHGIDAVLVSPATAEIWLVQAKWSDRGTALLGSSDVRKLLNGFERFVTLQYDRFNVRFQRLAEQVGEVLTAPNCRIHLVLAALGEEALSPATYELLVAGVSEFNTFEELLDFRVLGIADFHAALRRAELPEPVSVSATLSHGWHEGPVPYQTYVGTVGVDELAQWYEQHGPRLFDRNVRHPLGLTRVNGAMVDGLLTGAEEFWYFNNGVTVVCDSVRREFFGRRAQNEPMRLELVNARVVNGAQTVSSAHRAHRSDPHAVSDALVLVRIICLDGAPADLAQRITLATNAQNRVEDRDFVALDPQQELIRRDFARSLGKSYVLRRGEQEPAPAAGCSVTEAAFALACAHPDAAVVARLQQDSEALWHRGSEGVYPRLFGNHLDALQIWRSVKFMREVRNALAVLADGLEGRARMVADRAGLLIVHIVFQLVGGDGIDDPGGEWDARAESGVGRTDAVLSALIDRLGERHGRYALLGRSLRDGRSCRELVAGVQRALEHGSVPDAPAPRRKARRRRSNTVPLLVSHRRIADGTRLFYRPNSAAEREALHEWLSEAPERYLASWVNDPRKPLVWAVDQQRYSPTGLTSRIWQEAQWAEQPVAVRGTKNWYLPGEGTLAELADELVADADTAGDGPGAE